MPRCSLSPRACSPAYALLPFPPSPSHPVHVRAHVQARFCRVNACKTRATQNRHGRGRNHGCLSLATGEPPSSSFFNGAGGGGGQGRGGEGLGWGSARPCEHRIFPFSLLSFFFFPLLLFFFANKPRNETTVRRVGVYTYEPVRAVSKRVVSRLHEFFSLFSPFFSPI